ncbi:MAG: efflux RND transporter periplasmic adaptor subunit [Hyphomicrobiales bacterium]|nr:efflux RND transporter periplasmic adaptor subunit [Hyphomicrobiales bacterium]MBV8827319.1 efflux RND transporter periplasmic adaptor subunit [Hyphomicrobiales bacterium]MBV9427029.1 efflux RND transporter periplasmic adaptor subunit [Bradyrhizobiaceae bacterium]
MRKTILALTVALAPALAGCGEGKSQQQAAAPPPPAVTIAKPVSKSVADRDEYVGRFVAIESVETRARVSGYLDAIHFHDGEMVRQGDLLFTIDRRPFEIAFAQAQAALEQARANLAFAQRDLTRAQGLGIGTVITQQTFDQRTQAERAARASVAAQEAAVRQAALDLEFTELRAPVSGRVGDRRVSIGNLVTGGTSGSTTLLATIESLDPIRFEFTVDEASYLRYARLYQGSAAAADRGLTVPVRLKLIDETAFSHEGHIDFVDNTVDRAYGTVRARAVFANPGGIFLPGMFARVQVAAAPPKTALLVPEGAIGSEQARKFVLVVDDESVARPRYVTLGPVVDGLRVITGGLTADDNVIVNGLVRARAGTKVAAQKATTAALGDARPSAN